MNSDKIILDLCGGTGSWSRPYKEAGYDVRLITLPDNDVCTYEPPENVYGVLAAPPCTEFAVSGAAWWKSKPPEKLELGLRIVDACLDIIKQVNPKFWALENPVGRLKRLRYERLGEPSLIFNPCDYGDPYTKRTLLWGNFKQLKKNPVEPEFVILPKSGKRMSPNHFKSFAMKPKERAEYRSITPTGFARAFFEANQ